MASRILDLGDILTLIEQAQKAFDEDEAVKVAEKFATGEDFTLEDFLEPDAAAASKMGSMKKMLGMLPGMGQMREQLENFDEREIDRTEAIIHSMTPGERRNPKMLNGSRRAAHRPRLGHDGDRGQRARQPLRAGREDDAQIGRGRRHAGHPGHGQPAGHGRQEVARTRAGAGAQGSKGKSGNPAKRARSRSRRSTSAGGAGSGAAGSAFGIAPKNDRRVPPTDLAELQIPPGLEKSWGADRALGLRSCPRSMAPAPALRHRRPRRRARGRRGLGGSRTGTFSDRPSAQGTNTVTLEGWVLPGLVDVHCHIGLGADGAVDAGIAEEQALADRDCGRAARPGRRGRPLDTRWVHDRARPAAARSGRAGTSPVPSATCGTTAASSTTSPSLPAAVREEAARGDGWVKLVGDWIDRDLGAEGDLRPLWPADVLAEAVAAAHAEARRVTAHTFATEVARRAARRRRRLHRARHRRDADHIDASRPRGIPVTRDTPAGRAVRGHRRAG